MVNSTVTRWVTQPCRTSGWKTAGRTDPVAVASIRLAVGVAAVEMVEEEEEEEELVVVAAAAERVDKDEVVAVVAVVEVAFVSTKMARYWLMMSNK